MVKMKSIEKDDSTRISSIAHKNSAVDFLTLAATGDIEKAFKLYVDPDLMHHNPFFPAGLTPLRNGMLENARLFPDKQIIIKHVLSEGDLTAVHSHIILKPGDAGISAVHLFRFKGSMIIEMWDCGQQLPENSPNGDGAF